jgi:hypothetical protein
MATDTEAPVKERSVPKPVFTDAEAGAKKFPSGCTSTCRPSATRPPT